MHHEAQINIKMSNLEKECLNLPIPQHRGEALLVDKISLVISFVKRR
jgi:hypothetical protein